MRVLVCGDRHWSDWDRLYAVLDKLQERWPDQLVIIEGDAKGADKMAGCWALDRKVGLEVFPADWARYGRGAGPIRNRQMLDAKPDLVVAFHDQILLSKGTKNMIEQAEKEGVEVLLISDPEVEWIG